MITCSFEDGGEAKLRHVVTDNIVLNDKKQILLVKRALHVLEGGKYALIGGYVDRNERISHTVEREILEETGYKSKIDYLLHVKDSPDRPNDSERQNISFVFVAHALEKVGSADDESTEQTWFNLDALPPKEQFAFDHYDDIERYLKTLDHPSACNHLLNIS